MAIQNATPLLQLRAVRNDPADTSYYLQSASPAFEHLDVPKSAQTLDEAEKAAVAIAQEHNIAVLVVTVASKVVPWFPACQLFAEEA